MEPIPENLKIEFNKAKLALEGANKICIISHRSPDADAVGSNLALRFLLEAMGKIVVSACTDQIPSDCVFLKKSDTFVDDFNYEDFDLIVSVDCGAIGLVKFHEKKPEILSGNKPFINFDHHESNEHFGTINPVNPEYCATSYILYQFFEYCGWPMSRDMVTCLLHGIYFDTGSLMHSNTTASVYRVVGQLILKGADLKTVVKHLFNTTPVGKLRLWGRVMERAYVNEDNVVVSAISKEDYAVCGASSKDTGGAIDFLNAVPDAKYCVLLTEDNKGLVKGSLRTQRDDVNLSDVASQWGGGGHPKASGFGIQGKLRPVMKWQIFDERTGAERTIEF